MSFKCNLTTESKKIFRQYILQYAELSKSKLNIYSLTLMFISEYICGYLFLNEKGEKSDGVIMHRLSQLGKDNLKPLINILRKLRNELAHKPYDCIAIMKENVSSLIKYGSMENLETLFEMFEEDAEEIRKHYENIINSYNPVRSVLNDWEPGDSILDKIK